MHLEEGQSKHDEELIARNRVIARKFAEDNCPFQKLNELCDLKLKTYDRNMDTVLKIKAYDNYIQFTIISAYNCQKTNLSGIVEYEQDESIFKKKVYNAFNFIMQKLKNWNG